MGGLCGRAIHKFEHLAFITIFLLPCFLLQNSTSEMNQTTDGLLSSILNDEDLQLMDMAMTEGKSDPN